MKGKEIAAFLRKYGYSYHFKNSIHYFNKGFTSSWPKLILAFVILITLIAFTFFENNEKVLSTEILVGIESVAFTIYLLLVLKERTYSVEFDLSKRLIRLIPRSEFISRREILFSDVTNVDVGIKEVANHESPFNSFKVFSKCIKIETQNRCFTIIEISNKSSEVEKEILVLKSVIKKWLHI
ncbi:MAG: hypothetical protein RIF46_05165 [Cyclobacteriaceae bacterium]